MYAVILAGGGGTRLRPLSTPSRPKPFLPLLGEETLLQGTVRRLAGLVPTSAITVVTDRRYEELVRAQLPQVGVIAEPVGRNTAAAVALATLLIDRPDDDTMLVLPADQVIEREVAFREGVRVVADCVASGTLGIDDPLVTFGISPHAPSSEYGYLVPFPDDGRAIEASARRLRSFEEKPGADRARELLRLPGIAWNAGMFLWRRRAIRAALCRYTTLIEDLGAALGAGTTGALAAAYERVEPTPIDVAVMEQATSDGHVVVAGLDVGWSDLGSWPALLGALGAPRAGLLMEPGQTVTPCADDLLLVRKDESLVLFAGDGREVTAESPMAVLRGAVPARSILEALIERVGR